MKFTLSWLKEHLETDASLDALTERMTMTGLNVEDVQNPADKFAQFSVAKIVSVAKHPNADKLQVCQVETRDGAKEIVCGAPNARAGLVTAYAPIGAFIPGSGVTLEARPVRGVVSNGMLCSGAELELGTDADGIMELPGDLEVGAPLARALDLDDPVIDFEVTPNRPDWLGVAGIARDLAAAGLGKLKTKSVMPIAGRFPSSVRVATEWREACPVFAGRLIRGVKNRASPEWMQRRLRAVGLRPRNALVDITNYVSLDRARPLHVYDAAKLDGVVRARMGRDGETLLALDGRIYDITPAMCVIADDTRVLGLGGVMGGEHSGCSEETVDVLVESAWFDPLRTFQAGRATGINSDAKYRFERGVDPGFVVGGVELATRLILDCCGGEPSEIMVAGEPPAQNTVVSFDPDRVRQLAGLAVTPTRVRAILKTLGFETEPEASGAKRLRVTAPSWRRDIEGPADLVEEIARIEGFENVSMNAPPRAEGHRAPRASVGESRLRVARRALAGAGYLEAVTWSFTPHRHAALFGGGGASVLIANPIAADLDCMRPTPLPNLIVAAQKNLDRGYGDARLFEAGPAFGGDRDEDQSRVVAAIWQPRPQRHWRAVPAPDLFDLKRDCLMTLEALGAPVQALLTGAEAPPWWRPGRAGVLKIGPRAIAAYGEIHPRVLTALGASGPMLAFEIQVDALAPPRTRATRAKPALELNDLMPLTRDFAFVMDEATPAADLVRAAFGADKQLIADVALFDVYRGEGVGAGKKSLAVEVTLQPREQTLTEAEIEAVSQRIASAVAKATGATLRT